MLDPLWLPTYYYRQI